MKKEKIMFLYLKAGGGHLSAAKALADELSSKHPNFEPVLVDAFEGVKNLGKFFVEDGYQITAQTALKDIYRATYTLNSIQLVADSSIKLFKLAAIKNIKKFLIKEKPDRVVILHFLLVKPMEEIFEECELDWPITTVVTDPFTAHSMWFSGKFCKYIVFSKDTKRLAVKKKIQPRRVKELPIILNKRFDKKATRAEVKDLKKKYKLLDKSILIFGGGDGLKNSLEILRQIRKAKLDVSVSIICGKNKVIKRFVDAYIKRRNMNNCVTYEFTDKIYELLNSHDYVITKAGPASIMEILSCEKVPIIASYIWKQEKGNVDYVVKNKLGYYSPESRKIVNYVKRMIKNPSLEKEVVSRIKKLKIKSGTSEIVRELVK